MNMLGDQRRSRLLSMRAGLPAVMWAVLLGAGAVTIGFSFLFGTRNPRAQAVMTGALALTIGIVLLSIVALEHPFRGITRVQAEAFEQAQEIFGSVIHREAMSSP
jgi:protein-S-isoprenylcysteine O-methyltransferase Ste14